MAKIDWDALAERCDANHDLYDAAHRQDPEAAKHAIDRGADVEQVVKWLDEIDAINFFLNIQLAPPPRWNVTR
jgi:hypothetical protein